MDISLIFSLVSLTLSIFSVLTNFIYGKKQNELNTRLNNKEKREEEDSIKANITASKVREQSQTFLRLMNDGKYKASEVTLEYLGENFWNIDLTHKLPIDIPPAHHIDLVMTLSLDAPTKQGIIITWQDGRGGIQKVETEVG